jgi:hypothetical protein
MDIIQGFIGIFFTDRENNLSNSLNKILFTTSKPGNLLKSCMEFNNLKLIIIL